MTALVPVWVLSRSGGRLAAESDDIDVFRFVDSPPGVVFMCPCMLDCAEVGAVLETPLEPSARLLGTLG